MELPPAAEQQGISGTVTLLVSLDDHSRIAAVRIGNSPSPLLNDAALAATRASTFQTDSRDCRTVAADYVYAVSFETDFSFSTTPSGDKLVTVAAQGAASKAADRAEVSARIVTSDDPAANATARNDALLALLNAKLRAAGFADAIVSTTTISADATLPPDPRHATRREIVVRVRAFADATKVAAVVATAAAPIDRTAIVFSLADRASADGDALKNALAFAESRARSVATNRHLHLGALQHVDVPWKNGAVPLQAEVIFPTSRFEPGSRLPNIEVPKLKVQTRVNVTYRLEP